MKFDNDLIDALLFLTFVERVDFFELATTRAKELLFAKLFESLFFLIVLVSREARLVCFSTGLGSLGSLTERLQEALNLGIDGFVGGLHILSKITDRPLLYRVIGLAVCY